jgi:Bacterial archaeo-eukaryotic release factor family 2
MKLGPLRPLYDACGDYVSVYLDNDRAHEDAQHAIELRWRSARERLTADGADPATLDAVQAMVTDPDTTGPGIAVFARHGAVRLSARLADAPRREIARLASLPHVLPMLAQHQSRVPHLRVAATRTGGEILAVTGMGGTRAEKTTADTWPVHKTPAGGWSQDIHQRSVEENWEANAKDLAARIAAAARQARAERIVVAGDIRARTLVMDHLDPSLREAVVVIDSEIPADSEALAAAADAAIAGYADQVSRERFGVWQSQRPRSGAVEGLGETVTALSDGRASEVFVGEEPPSAAAWIGPGGMDLATTAAQLAERGVGEPVSDRADAAVARAVACTDAELWFLAAGLSGPRDGIGAILRYPAR